MSRFLIAKCSIRFHRFRPIHADNIDRTPAIAWKSNSPNAFLLQTYLDLLQVMPASQNV